MDAVPRLARIAADRIGAGALNGQSVGQLARELGVSARHLRRSMESEIGVSPLELAQTHRLLLAKRLLADTSLSVTRVAYASGFKSLRRFNASFREQYRLAPSAIRRAARTWTGTKLPLGDDAPLNLTLSYRAPYAWDALLSFLRSDAMDGVEIVDGRLYGRTIHVAGCNGFIVVEDASLGSVGRSLADASRPLARGSANYLNVAVSQSLVPVFMPLLARLRQLLDLDANPALIDTHLAQAGLGALVARRPGVRIPGTIDGFEVALRAILRGHARTGHGMSLRDPARRVVWELGEPLETGIPALSRLTPTPERVADAGSARLEALGIPRSRATAAVEVARLVADGTLRLEPGSDAAETRGALTEIPGVGDRVATTIVMRALSWPDALSITDGALQRAAGVSTARELSAHSERWRPWRAYAAMHLWLEREAR
jgi:AraC family transcriptional regulator of adaptative response / DNA-3-methyladenine glycosylase II